MEDELTSEQLEAVWETATPEERWAIMLKAYGPNTKLKDYDGVYLTPEQTLKKMAEMKFSHLLEGTPIPRGMTRH